MTLSRLTIAVLLFVAATFTGCDSCNTRQKATECWVHGGLKPSTTCPARGDDKEPNDLLPIAGSTTISCTPAMLRGTLGPGDVDVYQAAGSICPGSRPQASWAASAGRLCLFAGCNHGLMNFDGCASGTPTHFREGILGCCTKGPGSVELESRCSLGEHDLTAWIVVDQISGQCEDYDVSFHD